eukprot:scaffold30437_cov31-Tisochrysis_lutea.AAC.5
MLPPPPDGYTARPLHHRMTACVAGGGRTRFRCTSLSRSSSRTRSRSPPHACHNAEQAAHNTSRARERMLHRALVLRFGPSPGSLACYDSC